MNLFELQNACNIRDAYLSYMNSRHYVKTVSQNIVKLLSILKPGGILHLSSERIVVTDQDKQTRMKIIQKIIDDISPLCHKIDFNFDILPFSNPGWLPSNATLTCHKK